MIVDSLAQCDRYTALSPRFATAFKFLESLPVNPPPGRYELDGDRCFALVQAYTTRPHGEARLEAHKQYIDIQFIQAGCETILWSPLTALTKTVQPYDAGKDIAFYATPARVTPINLGAGEFAIFFPDDAHAPGLECVDRMEIRKVVIKVHV